MAFKLPGNNWQSPTTVLTDPCDTRISDEIASRQGDDTELTGVRMLREGRDAFAARASLARIADRSIDVQYYIWHDDLSGSLMFDELEAAADRGVRVRILVDDVGIPRLDKRLACLDRHEHISIKLYNPFVVRRPKAINWLFDFDRLNRRMHSKSFIVDNQAAILGGRNIGDEYFGAREDGLFADLDVLAVGAVVPEVSEAFDHFWNSDDSYPAATILKPVSDRSCRRVARKARKLAASEKAEQYREAIATREIFEDIAAGTVPLEWVPAQLINHSYADRDPPDPADLGFRDILPDGLADPEHKLDMISAYFVPTERGTRELSELANEGTKVRILTNSYAATDVGFVHAGYVPYRKRLLKAGVRLFEMPAPDDKPRTARKFVRNSSLGRRSRPQGGRTLHAKAIAIDEKQLYVGSANFDPRSACFNTELGLIIESPRLAAQMSKIFEEEVEPGSYCVGVDEEEQVYWVDARDDEKKREYVEPHTNPFSRALIRMISRFPFERLL